MTVRASDEALCAGTYRLDTHVYYDVLEQIGGSSGHAFGDLCFPQQATPRATLGICSIPFSIPHHTEP